MIRQIIFSTIFAEVRTLASPLASCRVELAAAMNGFRAEEAAGNRAYRIATAVLKRDFSKADHDGPIRAAQFLGENGANRDRIRQDLVTVGRRLLGI